MIPATQTAVVLLPLQHGHHDNNSLPLTISHSIPTPNTASLPPHHVLVRVLAAALNPTDYKMTTRFSALLPPNVPTGCDFFGVVESLPDSFQLVPPSSFFPPGTRVCGATFPYRPANDAQGGGAFAQYLVADTRHLLRVPSSWSDTQAAALGATGWGTVAMAISDPQALGLTGLPSAPVQRAQDDGADSRKRPVLVYGGGTATGLMAIQLLKLCGYNSITICSPASSPLTIQAGASGTVPYTGLTTEQCIASIKSLAGEGVAIRHALDCITDAQSSAVCFGAIARTGGRYVCLDEMPTSSLSTRRRAVKTKVVMGFEMQGIELDLGENNETSRKARPELHQLGVVWTREIQRLLDLDADARIRTVPVRVLEGGLEAVVPGLRMLMAGEVKREKLIVQISTL